MQQMVDDRMTARLSHEQRGDSHLLDIREVQVRRSREPVRAGRRRTLAATASRAGACPSSWVSARSASSSWRSARAADPVIGSSAPSCTRQRSACGVDQNALDLKQATL